MSNSNDEDILSDAESTGSMEVIPNNDSASSEDEDDEEKERELELQAEELEKRLQENYYDYAAYENLVKIRRQLTDIDGLRKTFEKFSTVYPLTGDLWLLWIKSEIAIANSDVEIEKVTQLFEKAVRDYLSINVWLEYVQFGLKNPNIEKIRELFERAISAAGLHVPQGSLIWDAYREFELAHLSLITDIQSEEWLIQAHRVASIFKRQLSVPLSDMEVTYEELQNWIKELPRKDDVITKLSDYEYIYEKSQRDLKKISPYEEDVMNAKNDIEKLDFYEKYIDYEGSYPNRVNILYERAVNEIPLNAEFWLKYCKHTVNLGTESLALNVCKRSVRNCSWNSSLWVYFLQTLEYFEKDHDTITREFELGLVACSHDARSQLLLWLCYLEHCKRAVSTNLSKNTESPDGNAMETDTKKVELNEEYLRNVFTKANTHLYETWGAQGDPNCSISQFWARIEGSIFKDMEAARKIWTDIIKYGPKDTADLWLESLNLEIRFGDAKHVRRAHLRALNATKDWPNKIADSWLNYERECGTIQTIMECNCKCFEVIEKWKKVQLERQTHEEIKSYEKQKTIKNNQNYEKKHDKNDNRNVIERKRKSEYKEAEEERATKKTKSIESELNAISKLNMGEKSVDKHNHKNEKGYQPPVEMDPETESRTVFVSNLDYAVDEDRLMQFFGTVKSLRLVKDFKGRSKGFGYVELNSVNEVDEVLKRDRERLNDRPVFISRCKTAKEKREQAFKYSTTREQHKLFVKGLPLKITQEEIEKIFAPHGKIKDIRMVCYRNGHFKGLAYVEFEQVADASRALIKTDNTEIDGHVISVAISAPPQRNLKDAGDTGYKESGIRKSRIQIPLVPTIVQKKVVQNTTNDTENKPKSNDDFRKMLLK